MTILKTADNTTNEPRLPLTEDECLHTAHAMREYGGSFAGYIADAYYVADLGNRARLLNAFGDLFRRYGPDSHFYQR
jgi:hypothetical protein